MRDIASPFDGFASPFGPQRGFNPASLVTGSTAMAWYDPSDLSTLFQDDAATVPVTASGQAVAVMRDKSGNGNHARQTVAVSRPIYTESGGRRYLAFDGSNDFMVTGTITPSADKVQVFAGVRKLSDATIGILAELSTSSINNGTFAMFVPGTTLNGYTFRTRGTAPSDAGVTTPLAPSTNVITGIGDISGDISLLRVNGALGLSSSTDQGNGNYAANPIYIGQRGGVSNPFIGNLYGMIVRFSASNMTAAQISATEAWINQRTGAY